MCVLEGTHSLIESGGALTSLVDLHRAVGERARIRDGKGSSWGVRRVVDKWLVGHLGKLQLLLCLLLLHLFTRPLAMRALLLGTLYFSKRASERV